MNKITKQNDKLLVPDKVTIPFIEGDGVGAEITPVCQSIVNSAIKKAYNGKREILWKEVLAGELETAQLAMGISIAYDWGYRHLSGEVRSAVEKALKNVARPLLRNSVEFQSEK